jgi:geranylgeranyl diphosphate synthase type I
MRNSEAVTAFQVYAAQVKLDVDVALTTFLDARHARAANVGPPVEAVVGAMRSLALRGGKRFRPVLLAATYEGLGGVGGARAVTMAGVALEVLQTYFLIHDDWMDGDEVRRGGPSVHAQLRQRFGSRAIGDATAILAGDYAASLANEALLATTAPCAQVLAATRAMAEMQESVCFGQVLDICGGADDVEQMHDLKTGSYTVRGPMAIGGALAGACDARMAGLDRFARPLGVAFQIRDDILGTFGSPATTGKPAGNDLRQGKRTALVAGLAEDARAAPLLARAFGRADASDDDVQALTDYLVESGALARAEARLEALTHSAMAALDALEICEGARQVLTGAVAALARREH